MKLDEARYQLAKSSRDATTVNDQVMLKLALKVGNNLARSVITRDEPAEEIEVGIPPEDIPEGEDNSDLGQSDDEIADVLSGILEGTMDGD
jgi:hypothetical protein